MRLPTRSFLVLALLLAGCGDDPASGPTGGRAQAPRGFQGKFTGQGPAGSLTLRLVQTGDVVEIHSDTGLAVGKLVAPNRVEAETREGELVAHIVLLLEGDDLRMQSRIEGFDQEIPDVVLKRVAAPTAAGGASLARDARLVAHWRNTETRASEQLSYAKDTHLVLEADGTFETWDRTVSSLSGTEESARTRGTWKTEGGQLWIKPDPGAEWYPAGKYGLTDTHLMLTDARGEKTIYERL